MLLLPVIVLCSLPMVAKGQCAVFNKYADNPQVSSVYISKAMIVNSRAMYAEDWFVTRLSDKLNSVQILQAKPPVENLRKDVKDMLKSSSYELLVKQRKGQNSSTFYMKRKGEEVKELIMVTDGAYFKFLFLEGDMTLDDLQKIILHN